MDKIEPELRSKDVRRAWNGMKTMTGLQEKGGRGVTLDVF